MDIIKKEMLEIRDQYGDERRTEIVPVDSNFSMEDMIAEEEVVLTITHPWTNTAKLTERFFRKVLFRPEYYRRTKCARRFLCQQLS